MSAIKVLYQVSKEAGVEKAIELIEPMFQDKNQDNHRISNLAKHLKFGADCKALWTTIN